jgi:nitrogen regulatory protein PII
MREIKAIIQSHMLEKVLHALGAFDELPGVTVSQVMGWGKTRAADAERPVREAGHAFAKKTKLEIVVPAEVAPRVVEILLQSARTGQPGDGKIFEYQVDRAVKIRTGEEGHDAL